VANALVHAFYGGQATVRVILKADWLLVTNSGTFVIDPAIAVAGGASAPRNPALMQILGHLGRIDRAGTGLNAVWQLWEREFSTVPSIEQRYEPLEIRITVPLALIANVGDTANGTAGDKTGDNADTGDIGGDKAFDNRQMILNLIESSGSVQAGQVSSLLNLRASRTREILAQMVAGGLIEAHGERKGRYYCLPGYRSEGGEQRGDPRAQVLRRPAAPSR